MALEKKKTLQFGIFSMDFFSCRVPPFRGKQLVRHSVTRVSHSCLLIELGPICNSMAVSLCFKSCEDHKVLKSYNGGLWTNIYRS